MKELRRIFVILALIGLYGQTSARIGFYPQKEYRYEYVGQVLSGIPDAGNDQTAVSIAANVIVQTENNNLLVQLENVRTFADKSPVSGYFDPNTELPCGDLYQPLTQPEIKLPFRILYKGNSDELNGIEASPDDLSWSVNVKKAFAAFLQVRVDQQLSRRQGYFADSRVTGSYEPIDTIELSVDGRCPTRYVFSSFPPKFSPIFGKGRVVNVTKIRDVKNCVDQPVWKQSISEPLKCLDCEAKDNILTHANQANYDLYEENGQYTLQGAKAFSQLDIRPLSPKGHAIRVTQFQRLTLKDVGRVNTKLNAPPAGRSVLHSVLGVTPDDVSEVPISRGPRYRRQATKTGPTYTKISPIKKQPIKAEDKDAAFRKRLEMLYQERTSHTEENLWLATVAVDDLRKLTYDELQQLYNLLDNEDKKTFLVNLIVMTGTDASILFIKNLIEQNKITGEAAVNTVSNLAAYILEPKPAILEEIWGMCKSNLVKQSRQLYVTTLLAFGELVNQACVSKGAAKTVAPFRVQAVGCPTSLSNRYLQEVTRMFEQSPETWERITLALTMMRMGLNSTIDYIKPLLQHKYYTFEPSVRATLLMSLYETGPQRGNDVLMQVAPIFFNKSLGVEERLIAMDVLAYTTTSQQVMNQIALSTWTEENEQFHAYVYSYLTHVSTMVQPCWAAMAARSRQALPLAKHIDVGILDSRYGSINNYAKQWSLASLLGYGFTFAPDSPLPKMIYGHIGNQIGPYYYSTLETMFMTEGLQKAVDYLTGPQSYYPHDYKIANLFQDEKDNTVKKAKYQHDDVKVNPRKYAPLNTFWWVSYLGTRHRVFFLDSHTLDDLRNSGIIPRNKDLYSAVRDGIPVNIQKYAILEDTQIKFSSAIGVQLKIEFKIPLAIEIKGKISIEVAKSGISNALSVFSIKPDIQTSFALHSFLGVTTSIPYSKSTIGAYAARYVHFKIPIAGNVNFDLAQRSITTGFRQPISKTAEKGETPIFIVKTNPAIFLLNLETLQYTKHDIRRDPSKLRVSTSKLEFGLFGKPMTNTIKTDMSIQEEAELQRELAHEGPLHLLTFWWAPHRFNYREVASTQPASNSDTNLVELRVNWKLSPTPYEEELWRGKSSLQKLRLWNFIPEWYNLPLPCDALDDSAPYRATYVETTTKKSWFGRFKDKVKNTFGRSLGEDVDDSGEDDDKKDDDDKDDDEDRGRALHPHLVTGGGSDSAPGSRSSLTGYTDSNSQSRSAQGGYGGSSGGYGGESGGYGSQSGGYGGQSGGYDSQTSGGQDFSQTQYGGGAFDGQSQHGGGDDDDYTQQGSRGHDKYAPGTGPGSAGRQTYPYKPSTGDPLTAPKKAVVKVIDFKNEISNTLIAIQLNTLGNIKSQINADITISKNRPQGVYKFQTSVDIGNAMKACAEFNYYNQNTKCPGRLTRDGISAETKFQWGATCDQSRQDTNYINFKGTLTMTPEVQTAFDNLKRRDNVQKNSFVNDNFLESYRHEIFLEHEAYEIRYSKNVPLMIKNLTTYWEKEMCYYNDYLASIIPGQFVEDGKVLMDKLYYDKGNLIDFSLKTKELNRNWENLNAKDLGVFAFPLSPYYSFPYQVLDELSHGKVTDTCGLFVGKSTSGDKVVSFNEIVYSYPNDACEYVLAKDCSPSQLWTVTVSSDPNKVIQKVTVHLLDHKLNFVPTSLPKSGGGVDFEVDGAKQSLQKGQSAVVRSQGYDDYFLATVSAFGPKVIIKSPFMGFEISVSAAEVRITLSQSWKGKACGLCGEYTGEPHDTYVGADQCRFFNSKHDFDESFRLTTPKCPNKPAPSLCQSRGGSSGTTYPSGYGDSAGNIRRPSEGFGPYGGQTLGGGSYDEHVDNDDQLGQPTGHNSYGQISQTSHDYEATYIKQDKSPYGGRYVKNYTTSGSLDVEAPIVAQTYAPQGGGDDGPCIVRRNLLKRLVATMKGTLEAARGTRTKKLCFSTDPVRQCRRSCVGINLAPQTVVFTCYNEPHAQAEKWANEINDRPLTDLVQTGSEFEEEIMVAQDCEPQY